MEYYQLAVFNFCLNMRQYVVICVNPDVLILTPGKNNFARAFQTDLIKDWNLSFL